jgi:hypothetical protein
MLPRLGGAPHHDVEEALVLEELARLGSLDHRGHGPAHLTGSEAEPLGPLGSKLDLDLRDQHLRLRFQIDHTVDRRQSVANRKRMCLQPIQIGPLNPHDDGRAGTG